MPKFLTKTHYWLILGAILLFAFATRVYRLDTPPTYIFDEVYHAVTAKLIKRNDPRAYEWWNPPIEPNTAVDWLHPPLAKYTQAVGMMIFGENAFGWRISAAVFGVGVIAATAAVSWELFESYELSLLAAFLASLDGLLLVQSRIAMNDIHVTFFILLTTYFYVRYRKSIHPNISRRTFYNLLATGLCAGLAMGSKWSGVFILGTIWFFEVALYIVQRIWPKNLKTKISKFSFTSPFSVSHILFLALLPALVYLLSYSHMFLQGKSLICLGNQAVAGQCYCHQDNSFWVEALKTIDPAQSTYFESLEARGGCKRLISHFDELHHQIWWYQTNLKATHPYQSRPLDWFLDARPVWMYVDYGKDTIANIYSQGNPLLFWSGDAAVIGTLFYLIYQAFKNQADQKKHKYSVEFSFEKNPFLVLIFLLVTYAAQWVLWEGSPRIMFFYHYTPAVPFLCIILAYWLMQISKETWGRAIVGVITAAIFVNFIVFYPNWTGIPVPLTFANSVYFFLKTWK